MGKYGVVGRSVDELGMQGEQIGPAMKGRKGDFRGVQRHAAIRYVSVGCQGKDDVGEPEHG